MESTGLPVLERDSKCEVISHDNGTATVTRKLADGTYAKIELTGSEVYDIYRIHVWEMMESDVCAWWEDRMGFPIEDKLSDEQIDELVELWQDMLDANADADSQEHWDAFDDWYDWDDEEDEE